jgi:hypothetical protein
VTIDTEFVEKNPMSNSVKTRFLNALAGSLAAFRLAHEGHLIPIGVATLTLLKQNKPVTRDALIAEMRNQPPGDLRERGIRHLLDTIHDASA